VSKIFSTLKP